MHRPTSDKLFNLINSMSKAEKRAFRLFAERTQSSSKLLFIQLIDLIRKDKTFDESRIKINLGAIDSSSYANLKRHLYQQLLISLRLVKKTKSTTIKVREMIDFAFVLYDKGLYIDALSMLEKTRKLCKKHRLDFMELMVIEVEKMIHSRHITRSKSAPIINLISDATLQMDNISNRVKLSNLRLILHKFYIEKGHVKNIEEQQEVEKYFTDNLPDISLEDLGVIEKIHLYQSYVWYYYILNDFNKCFEYSLSWIAVFGEDSAMIARDYTLFLRGYHYLLTSLYHTRSIELYQQYQAELELFRHDNYQRFDHNTKIVSFIYVYTARLNYHIMMKQYHIGVKEIPKTLARLKRYGTQIDTYKVMLFYFKFAWLLLRNGQAKEGLPYLQWIMSMTRSSLRTDIQVYARLMTLMCHYQLGDDVVIISLIRQYDHFFKRISLENQMPIVFLGFFKKICSSPINEREKLVLSKLDELKLLFENPFEQKAFLYLDIIDWLESIRE